MSATSFESFEQTCVALGATRKIAEAHAALLDAYSEKHRAYHTLAHVEACLQHLNTLRDLAKAPEEIALALWFHDAVYKSPALFSNEKASARMALRWGRAMGISEESLRRIESMILRTETHAMDPGESEQGPDLALFLDIDLAILGADEVGYATFERDIRAEYRWVPLESLYTSGRVKALRRLLARKPIYATERMRSLFEARAQENIRRTIPLLEAVDSNAIRTTNSHFYRLAFGRLAAFYPWSDLASVTCQADGLYCAFRFMRMDLPGGAEDLLDGDLVPWSDEVSIARIRSLPNYDGSREGQDTPYVYQATLPIPPVLTGQAFR
jgi:predicted metal-dependent HD superfamily phosphohydrolase